MTESALDPTERSLAQVEDIRVVDHIRIEDVLAWEPRLRIVQGAAERVRQPVSWAVAAKALPPILPKLRGGEIVLVPAAVETEQHVPLPALVAELAQQQVAAVVVDDAPSPREGLPDLAPVVLLSWHGTPVSVETESELNRLFTEHRGENYRLGTELGRLLSNLTATGAGLKQVLDVTHQEIALPVFVTDRTGIVLAASGGAEAEPDLVRFDVSTADPSLIEHPLRGGGRLWLGPVPSAQRAVARVAADRAAVAVEASLSGANWFRSRGPERGESLTRFILTAARREPSDARVRAVALGLDPGAAFRVALSPRADLLQPVGRGYGPFGAVHELSDIAGLRAALIELKPERTSSPQPNGRDEGGLSRAANRGDGVAWVAQSAAVTSLAQLSEAARQATYVAGLLGAGLIRRSSVHFDRATELGAYRLLYDFWGSSELGAFASAILGDLLDHDRSGTLRQTLLHFLESGGSRVEAAERAAIHRNTLAYRLRRIAELTKLDPNEPDDRLSLHLAILAQSMPGVVDTDGGDVEAVG